MLDEITPVILTYNEEPNLGRTLSKLTWARDIVVLDSFSTDATAEIARQHPQVRFLQRPFDSHRGQWSHAVKETGIGTEWVLALDADYVLTDALVAELDALKDDGSVDGYRARFRYCVEGKALRGTIYPPVTVLYRNAKARYVQDGHTQRIQVDGPVATLRNPIRHDDRKSLSRWLASQDRYSVLEADELVARRWSQLSIGGKLRRFPLLAPFAVFAITYLGKGTFLDGRSGLYYALQRLVAELIVALRYLERRGL